MANLALDMKFHIGFVLNLDDSTSHPPRVHRITAGGLPCSLGAKKKNILPKGKSNLNLRVVEEGAKW
jgi:hypothetical protein